MQKIFSIATFFILLFFVSCKEETSPLLFAPSKDGKSLVVCGFKAPLTAPTNLIIPKKFNGKPVTEIAPGAFKRQSFLQEVTIPRSITKIGMNAFAESYITKLTLDASISEEAVAGCDSAFFECSRLKEVFIGEGVEALGVYWFYAATFEEVALPKSVKLIKAGCFSYSSFLKEVVIDEGTKSINFPTDQDKALGAAFQQCKVLSEESKARLRALGYKGEF